MRKVYVNVVVKLIVLADDDVDISDVISDMFYSFDSDTEGADIDDSEITSYEIIDSK